MPWVARNLELVPKGTSADLKLEENGGQSNVCTWPDSILDKPSAFQTLLGNQNQRDSRAAYKLAHLPVRPSRRRIYKFLLLSPLAF